MGFGLRGAGRTKAGWCFLRGRGGCWDCGREGGRWGRGGMLKRYQLSFYASARSRHKACSAPATTAGRINNWQVPAYRWLREQVSVTATWTQGTGPPLPKPPRSPDNRQARQRRRGGGKERCPTAPRLHSPAYDPFLGDLHLSAGLCLCHAEPAVPVRPRAVSEARAIARLDSDPPWVGKHTRSCPVPCWRFGSVAALSGNTGDAGVIRFPAWRAWVGSPARELDWRLGRMKDPLAAKGGWPSPEGVERSM